MNNSLKSALDDYVTIKKESYGYKACYNSFLEYCDAFSDYTLKELFNNVITLHEIVQACKKYFLSSKKTKSLEAINRFLRAIDLFYKDYLLPSGITCKALENGCRNKQVIKWVCESLNQDLKQQVYLPLSIDEVNVARRLAEDLNDKKFYTLGQRIIFYLLLTYGFKAQVISEMLKDALKLEEKKIIIEYDNNTFKVDLSDELCIFFNSYCTLQKYPERTYLFTTTKGKKLKSSDLLNTFKLKIQSEKITSINSTTIALSGIERLIEKGFTHSEIKRLTGFEMPKIIDVSEYMLIGKNIEDIINKKLKQGELNIYK